MSSLIKILSVIERYLAIFFMGIMTLLVIFDVFYREVLNEGVPWAQKTAVYAMIWGGFLGAIMISGKAGHLRPEIGDKLWSAKPWLFVRLQNLLMLIFHSIFVYSSFNYVSESFEFGDKSIVLGVPLWLLQVIIPYTFFSMGLRSLYFFFNPQTQLEMKKEFN